MVDLSNHSSNDAREVVAKALDGSMDPTLGLIFELDREKLTEDVERIVEGNYFQNLQKRAKELRQKRSVS